MVKSLINEDFDYLKETAYGNPKEKRSLLAMIGWKGIFNSL
jgi:hypothetical protein